jgi:hypothetical protein
MQLGMVYGGAVQHVSKTTNAFGMLISACGRVLTVGESDSRLCKSCVRLTGYVPVKPERKVYALPEPVNSTTPQPYETWEYVLTATELSATLEKIEKLNNRCAKRGIPGGLTVEYREETRTRTNDIGLELEYVVYPTKISGIAPQLSGWQFIATIDSDPYAGIIVRTYPGIHSIDRTDIREGWCDHCKTTRYRKQTYVMFNLDTREQIQVGSSCIKDFTGWTALPVSLDRLTSEVEEMAEHYGSGGYDYTTKTVLSIAWACVQKWGFVRSGDYDNTPTVQRVRDVLNPPKTGRNPDYQYLADLATIRAYAETMPAKAIEIAQWVVSDDFNGDSEYVLNLKSIIGADKVSSRNYGLLCSAPQAWARWQEKTLIRKVEDKPVSEWQGEIKSAIEITATIESIRYIDGDYGVTTLYKLRDAAGNLFEWFASRDTLGEDTGTVWSFTATVKAHKEWQGHKTTAITRVRKATQQD